MTIREFATATYFLERDLSAGYRRLILWTVARFGRFIGRAARLVDFTSDNVNRYLVARMAERSRETARSERAVLHALWKAAFDSSLVGLRPDRVRIIKRNLRPVEAWTQEQVERLLHQAAKQPGEFRCGISRAAFWRAVVMMLYDTGLRLGDLRKLDAGQLHGPGIMVVIQSKTGKPVPVPISRETWEAVKAINPKRRKKPFGDVICERYFFPKFAELCEAAGLSGRTKMLRRTSGSLIERDHPGEGHLHLGNGREVFERHYHCRELTRLPPRLPPRLDSE